MSRKYNENTQEHSHGSPSGPSADSPWDDEPLEERVAGEESGEAPLDEGPSKSQRKRDAHDVRDLGQRLAELAPKERAALPLDDDVRRAIDELNAIVKHGARKRQLGFLAKRLRRVDTAPIEAALARLTHAARQNTARHHRLERWRDRLLGQAAGESPSAALTAFLDAHPDADRQRLRQLQKRALAERATARPPVAARELFRLLRDTPANES